MKRFNKIALVVLVAVSLAASMVLPVQADEVAELKALVNTLLDRVETLEDKVAMYEAKEQTNEIKVAKVEQKVDAVASGLSDVRMATSSGVASMADGINIEAGITSVYQFTDNANGSSLSANGEDVNDASYSLDLTLTKEFDEGTVFVALEAGQGDGVDGELEVFSGVNVDATGGSGSVELTEAWYEHNIGDSTWLTFGKIDASGFIDGNDYANDEAGQFLGSIFKVNPTIQFPDNGAGIRLAHAFGETVDVDVLAMDGDGDWDDMFDGPFTAAQINIKPALFDRGGNYRFYAWQSAQDHTEFMNAANVEEDNYGFGLSFDQELTDLIGMFVRYGYQNPDVYLNGGDGINIEHSYSVGMQLAGSAWGREDDVFGLAFGQLIPSDDYKNANTLKADDESHIEAYYNFVINDHLTVSPLVHVITDPYGGDASNGDKTIVVGGIRSQVDF